MSESQCGNLRHPDGPWHPATPVPFYSWRNRRAVRAYHQRQLAHGCGCEVRAK